MKIMINWLKTLYNTNKKMFIVSILIIMVFVLIGCGTSGGSAPSSAYVGGGC